MKELRTDRLNLRQFRREDTDVIHRIVYQDPEVYRWWGGQARERQEVEERVIYWLQGFDASPWGNAVVERKEDGAVMGFVALQPYAVPLVPDPLYPEELEKTGTRMEVEVSYVLGREFWGRGYATEAAQALVDYCFEDLRLERLVTPGIENPRSIALVRRLGYQVLKNYHPDWMEDFWVLYNPALQTW